MYFHIRIEINKKAIHLAPLDFLILVLVSAPYFKLTASVDVTKHANLLEGDCMTLL